jgi:hypothetical protein
MCRSRRVLALPAGFAGALIPPPPSTAVAPSIVSQREQRDDLRRVLPQAPAAHLREPELPLEHPERELDLATLALMLAFIFSTRSATKSGSTQGLSFLRRPGRIATCQVGPAASGRLCTPW